MAEGLNAVQSFTELLIKPSLQVSCILWLLLPLKSRFGPGTETSLEKAEKVRRANHKVLLGK